MQLSIQVPYTDDRFADKERLMKEFYRQIVANNAQNDVILQQDGTGKEMSIGEKRQNLYAISSALYTVQWDSDDWVATDFIERILEALKSGPDCITYYEHVDIDGEVSKSNHSIRYHGWHNNPLWPEGFKYARTPFFKDVIKTDIARSVEVPKIRWNEDEQFANALHSKLKTEVHIEDFMYFYKHVSSNPTERYGLDRD